MAYSPERLLGVDLDDTKMRKTERSIQQEFNQSDPLSPPFHVNLVLRLSFLQYSLLEPSHRTPNLARGLV